MIRDGRSQGLGLARSVVTELAERIWRVRKNHTWIDAQVRADTAGAEVRFYYDGALVFAQRWPTRAEAIHCANGHLRELQRAGWVTHW
jgi:hypothetical protein